MNAKSATWEQQLANIKHTMQAAREALSQPRPKRGRKHRAKVVPETKPADSPPDLHKEQREYEEAERHARDEQAEVVRNPYGSPFHPADGR